MILDRDGQAHFLYPCGAMIIKSVKEDGDADHEEGGGGRGGEAEAGAGGGRGRGQDRAAGRQPGRRHPALE